MSFWNIFKKKSEPGPVSEDVFIKKEEQTATRLGIHKIQDLMNQDFEQKGYDDALVNPDTTQMNKGLQIIKDKLMRSLDEAKIYYTDFFREVDFHIESRKANAMTTTVEELQMEKEKARAHYDRILEIEKENLNGRFEMSGMALTYKNGFEKGLAAISHTEIKKYNH